MLFLPAALLPLLALASAQAAGAASRPHSPAPPVTAPNSDWVQFHASPNGAGFNAAEHGLGPADAPGLTQRWVTHNEDPAGSPVVVRDRVYDIVSHFDSSGTEISELLAANRSHGTAIWHVPLDSAGGGVAVRDGRVFVTTLTQVAAFRASTGKPLWARADGFSREPTVVGDTVYVGSVRGYVEALAVKAGAVRWKTIVPGAVDSTVAVDGGRVFAVAADGMLYALNAVTGRIAWRSQVGHVFGGGPAVSGGVVYVGADLQSDSDARLIALRESDGRRLWSRAGGDDVHSVPATDGTEEVIGSVNGDVHAYSPAGALRWMAHVNGEVFSSIAIANGLAYLVTDASFVYALNLATGKVVWTTVPPQPCCSFATTSSIAESKEQVFVGFGDAGLRAYGLGAMP